MHNGLEPKSEGVQMPRRSTGVFRDAQLLDLTRGEDRPLERNAQRMSRAQRRVAGDRPTKGRDRAAVERQREHSGMAQASGGDHQMSPLQNPADDQETAMRGCGAVHASAVPAEVADARSPHGSSLSRAFRPAAQVGREAAAELAW